MEQFYPFLTVAMNGLVLCWSFFRFSVNVAGGRGVAEHSRAIRGKATPPVLAVTAVLKVELKKTHIQNLSNSGLESRTLTKDYPHY